MSVERVGRAEKEQKAEQAREEERRRDLQSTQNRAAEHITTVRVQDNKPTGEDRTTEAVSSASRHNSERGADWQAYADRNKTAVPVSVNELANQSNAQASRVEQDTKAARVGESEQSNAARHDAQRETVRRQAEQQMTIAEIQADMMRKSGIVKG